MQEGDGWKIRTARNAAAKSGGTPTNASSTRGEPVRVAGSGPAEPRRLRSAKKGGRAIGVPERPGAVENSGDRMNAVRVIGASIDEPTHLIRVCPDRKVQPH